MDDEIEMGSGLWAQLLRRCSRSVSPPYQLGSSSSASMRAPALEEKAHHTFKRTE